MWDLRLLTTVWAPRPVTEIALFYFLCFKRNYGTINMPKARPGIQTPPPKKGGWKRQEFFPQNVPMKEYYGL
jgi:hypothetical protein